MRYALLFLAISLLTVSCKKEPVRTNCINPDITPGTCVTDVATINTTLIGTWRWLQRSVGNKQSTPCTLNRAEDHYFVFFEDGTLYDALDMSCPLIGRYSIDSTAYLTSYVDTIYKYKTLEGNIKICNNYLVVHSTGWQESTDIYEKVPE